MKVSDTKKDFRAKNMAFRVTTKFFIDFGFVLRYNRKQFIKKSAIDHTYNVCG